MNLLPFVPLAAGFAVWIWWGVKEKQHFARDAYESVKAGRWVGREFAPGITTLALTYAISTALHMATGIWLTLLKPGFSWSGGSWIIPMLEVGFFLSVIGNFLGILTASLFKGKVVQD